MNDGSRPPENPTPPESGGRTRVPPDAMGAESANADWVDERLAHDRQRRRFKTILFYLVLFLCFLLYVIFFLTLWLLLTHTVAMQAFFAHKHTMALILALLLVPSVMLWGLIRAVYRVEPSPANHGDLLRSGMNMHPFG